MNIDVKELNKLQQIKEEMFKDNTNIKNENKHIDNKTEMNINNKLINKTNSNNDRIYNSNVDWKNREYKRGDVYWCNLSGSVGSEQDSDEKGRPCIIIQNDIGNKYSPTVIVAVLTSKMTKPKLPTHLQIMSEEHNLPKNSIALFEQVRTLDKRRLGQKICNLGDDFQKKLDNAIDISMKNLPVKTYLEKLPEDMRHYIITVLKEIKRKEIQIKEMKKDGFEEPIIKKVHDKKMTILKHFIVYCKNHELDYEKFYILNKGINEEVKSELIAL